MLAPLAGRVATVRVLDYGADKLPPFLHDDGGPGIALLVRHPDACDLRILLPMVDDAGQLDAVSQLLARARARPPASWAPEGRQYSRVVPVLGVG